VIARNKRMSGTRHELGGGKNQLNCNSGSREWRGGQMGGGGGVSYWGAPLPAGGTQMKHDGGVGWSLPRDKGR